MLVHVQPILHIYCSVQIMKTVPWSGLIGIDKHDSLLLVLYTVHGLVWFDKYCTVGSLSYASACYWRIR